MVRKAGWAMAGEQGSNETENSPWRGREVEAGTRGGEEQVPPQHARG